MTTIPSVSVFCGAAPGRAGACLRSAEALGRGLAERGIGIVYGGGGGGMMGALADAALAAGGAVVGVIPAFLVAREAGRGGLTELRVVETMHERKRMMFDLSQAACALPGGIGTLDEVIEVLAWRQLGLHDRPTVIVNVDGYWDGLAALVEGAVAGGFAQPSARTLLRFVPSAEEAVDVLARAARPRR